jgi:DNA-binding PucR family transcriptional regulator
VALDGGTVVALVHDDGEQAFEDELRGAIERHLPGTAVNIGAGTRCAKLADYRMSHISARRAVDLMRLVGRADDTVSFRRAGVEQMLLRSSEPEALVEFIGRYVDPLDRYDSAHSSQLRRTLEVYYDAGGRLEPAARALHIHVSTLRYRLGRVREVLGVDPRQGDSRLDLEVALRAARTLPVHRER